MATTERRENWELADILEPFLGAPLDYVTGSRGVQGKYRCPFHKGGDESTPSFFVNLENGLSFCHFCKDGRTLVQLLNVLNAPWALREEAKRAIPGPQSEGWAVQHEEMTPLPESLLGVFDLCPHDLLEAGFEEEVLREEDVGYDERHARITYPLRDYRGNLVGISGGSKYEHPKYLVYARRELQHFLSRGVPEFAPRKSNLIWGLERIWAGAYHGTYDGPIPLVEGFKGRLWLLQSGYRYTGAIFGSYLSKVQANFLLHLGNRFVLFLDQDEAGMEGTEKAVRMLTRRGAKVAVAKYPRAGKLQPDDLSAEEIHVAIEQAT